jgi:crossover junction endodeoxyribonuclease RuvC
MGLFSTINLKIILWRNMALDKMTIMGIDPGLAIVGYGVIEYDGFHMELIDYGAIYTPAKMWVPARLDIINDSMVKLMEKFKPDEVAFEELFFQNNQKTAIDVAQARGVCLMAAYKINNKIFEYTPLQVKQGVTGYGRADKKQVQNMVKAILGLKEIPQPDDAADAVAVAICHAQTTNYRSLRKY